MNDAKNVEEKLEGYDYAIELIKKLSNNYRIAELENAANRVDIILSYVKGLRDVAKFHFSMKQR